MGKGGLPEDNREAVQRCKSERSSCAKVTYESIEYGVLSIGGCPVSGGRWREDFREAGSGQRQDIAVLLVGARRRRDRGVRADAFADASLPDEILYHPGRGATASRPWDSRRWGQTRSAFRTKSDPTAQRTRRRRVPTSMSEKRRSEGGRSDGEPQGDPRDQEADGPIGFDSAPRSQS